MSSKMMKSLRKIASSSTNGISGGNSNNKISASSTLYLEDADFDEFQMSRPSANSSGGGGSGGGDTNNNTHSPTAIDHMNLPSLRPGAPTELHQAVLSHDWDGLRGRMGFFDPSDECRSNPSSQGENLGDAPNKQGNNGGASAEKSSSVKGLRSSRRGRRTSAANDNSNSRGLLSGSPSAKMGLSNNAQADKPIKRQHCLAREEAGRTPLHLILLRYTGGSLKKRTLRLRRAPDDVILGLINADPRAGGIPDREGMLPLHVAAREGHGIGVINAILESFPGSAAERDGNGKFPLDYALEYACQNAKKKKRPVDGGEETEDSRWAVVKCLLLASPESAVDSKGSMANPQQQQQQQQEGSSNNPLLLSALSKQAPESVVRMLIPAAAPYFSSRYGINDASTACYLAIANHYSLELMEQIVAICPNQTRSVRDETGMGLVAASYVVWAYGEGNKREGSSGKKVSDNGLTQTHWTKLKDHGDMMLSITKSRDNSISGTTAEDATIDDVTSLPKGFHDWWNKMKYWIMYYRPEVKSPADAGSMPAEAVDAFPEHLLHAALSNPDTPSPIVHIIFRLESSLASVPSATNDRLPLHLAAVTPCYTARHYEDNPLPYSTTELVYQAHPAAISARDPVTRRLPLHLALWDGRKTWEQGVAVLAKAEPRALRVKDWSTTKQQDGQSDDANEASMGLYPFQMAAVARSHTEAMKIRFAYQARNRHTNSQWRGMNVRQRAAEVVKVEAEHELNVLTTVFELLRTDPDVMNNNKEEGGTVVRLLAMRWGARARSHSKDVPGSAGKKPAKDAGTANKENPSETTGEGGGKKSLLPPLFPPSAMSTNQGVETGEEVDPFGSPKSFFTDFTEDSFDHNTNSPALQFVVEAGKGIVTEMPPSAYDVSASMQEGQGQLNLFVGVNGNGADGPALPSAVEGASPTGTALLSPDWLGTTALGSPVSQEQSATTTSSSDPIPQGYTDPHFGLEEEKTASGGGKKKSWFKVRSFHKGRRSNEADDSKHMVNSAYPISALAGAVGQMKGVPKQLDASALNDEEQDDYWCISEPSFSPSGGVSPSARALTVKPIVTDETDAELMILASARMQQNAIYKNWMTAYNVDQSDKEQSRIAPDSSREIALSRPRSRLETSPTAETAGTKDNGMLCTNCSSNRKDMLILPCRHLCLCSRCAKGNKTGGYCPVCQRAIFSTVEVFY